MTDRALDDDEALLAAAREGFVEEAAQLLADFESSLLSLEGRPDDGELLNAAFRAAHTIKGTAGLFGVEHVVTFTHEVETLLEAMRSGESEPSEKAIAVLLQSRDQIERLLEDATSSEPDTDLLRNSETLGAQLRALLTGVPAHAADTPAGVTEPRGARAGESTAPGWRIRAVFGSNALRYGLDPLSFLRYLGTMGETRRPRLVADAIPELEQIDPESCYLGFEVELHGESDYESVERAFEFAAEDCELSIVPLASPASDPEPVAAGDAAGAPDEAVGDEPAPAVADMQQDSGVPVDADPAAAGDVDERRAGGADRRGATADRRAEASRVVRVQADKLDALIDLIGELVIASSGAQIAAQQGDPTVFGEAAMRIRNLVESARDGALALRMVPIGETFARFHRVVRDVSKALGKDIELQVTGGDTELDKSMVEVIADPLMHLVRNSLDHGIEPSGEREAAGKPRRGRLALNAYHESGVIVIEVTDDGRGLNRDRILAKAVERGLVRPDEPLSDHEVYQLICQPGFSTAERISDISGRGVGMDVVKRGIEALRGQLLLASTPGKGMTTQVRLPLTLAIIDGFLFTVDDVNYVVPLESVGECIETPGNCPEGSIAGYFDLRGEVLPFLNVRAFLGHGEDAGGRRSMLVVRSGGSRVGLLVDRLLGEYQTVIKPLGPLFKDLRGIAGSTILGSGDVALILDVVDLVGRARDFARGTAGGAPSFSLGNPKQAANDR